MEMVRAIVPVRTGVNRRAWPMPRWLHAIVPVRTGVNRSSVFPGENGHHIVPVRTGVNRKHVAHGVGRRAHRPRAYGGEPDTEERIKKIDDIVPVRAGVDRVE